MLSILGVAGTVAALFTAQPEAVKLHAYRDGGGVWTVCRGHTKGVTADTVATPKQCNDWYIQDVAAAKKDVERLAPNLPTNVEAASIDFLFNTGEGTFAKSSMRRDFNKHQYAKGCEAFVLYKYQGKTDCSLPENKKVCGGLITRRIAEKTLCLRKEVMECDYFTGTCKPL